MPRPRSSRRDLQSWELPAGDSPSDKRHASSGHCPVCELSLLLPPAQQPPPAAAFYLHADGAEKGTEHLVGPQDILVLASETRGPAQLIPPLCLLSWPPLAQNLCKQYSQSLWTVLREGVIQPRVNSTLTGSSSQPSEEALESPISCMWKPRLRQPPPAPT